VVGTHEVGGFRFEAGPNTVQAGSPTFREITAELGIDGELIASNDSARTRWLWHRGRLRALPGSPPALLASPLFGIGSKWRLATEPLRRWRAPAPGASEPTLAEVLTERLGRQTTDLLAGAFVRGIYAGDHRELGARSAFPRLWRLLEEHGGLVRGMLAASRRSVRAELPGPDVPASRLLSFESGLGRLVEAFGAALGGVERRPRERTRDLAVGLAVPPSQHGAAMRRVPDEQFIFEAHDGDAAARLAWARVRTAAAAPRLKS
jgi:oxygen-dependent protoporphyrinogen oxidase